MKLLLTSLFTAIVSISFCQTTQISASIPALYAEDIPATVTQVFITDSLSGGMFYKYTGSLPIDSGMIVCDAAGDKFKRQLTDNFIRPEFWGAKGDGIADDLPALNKAVAYLGIPGGQIKLSRTYRITDTWVLGEKWLNETDMYQSNPTTAPSYNATLYIKTINRNPIQVTGENGASIYGDFTGSLKAVVFFAIYGDTRATGSKESYGNEFTNIGIYGQGSFVSGQPALKPNNTGYIYNTNQIGLVSMHSLQFKIEGCTFYGLKDGLVVNNTYFSTLRSNYFKLCNRGLYHMQSHGSVIDNPTAYYCNKAFEIRSGQVSMSNINVENCPSGLHIVNGSNTVNAAYLETPLIAGSEGQLIIGDSTGADCDGVIINALTIVSTASDGSYQTGIRLKKTAKRISINGGMINTSLTVRDSSSSDLLIQGVFGTVPSWVYKRDADINVKNATISGNLSVSGTTTLGALTATSITVPDVALSNTFSVDGEMKQKTSISNMFMKQKQITGLVGSTDYIITLGKYSVADGTKISGRLQILGNSAYTAAGHIDIDYSNLQTGYAKLNVQITADTKYLTIVPVKYTYNGDVWVGIRFSTNSSTAWIPCYFQWGGFLSSNDPMSTVIASSAVTNIVAMDAVDSKYHLLTNDFIIDVKTIKTPNFKSGVTGVKKGIYVDEFGNWSIQ